jgi:hypothetical protein
MPTSAKMVAAIILALTGLVAALAVQPFLPEGQRIGWLYQASIGIPIVCAWRTIGRMVGKSYWAALNTGFYGLFVSVFFVLLAFAAGEMLKRSIRLRYDGPMEAITSMFGIALEYSLFLINPPVLIVLLVGGAFAGLAAEWTNRRWA